MELPLLKNAEVKGKNVFLRADLDVPLSEFRVQSSEFRIEDDTRLKAALPTIEYLLKQNCKVIIGGHLGRPKGVDESLSLKPVAEWFAEKLIHNSEFIIHNSKLASFDGWEIGENIFLLENLRFNPGEEVNDIEFAKKLASLAEVYVNDAFAMCHRNHASVVGMTKFLPHFAGLHLEQEITHLNSAMLDPKRPLVVIIGGKKIETKLPLVLKMYELADYVLIGGKIAKEHQELLKIEHKNNDRKKALLLIADLNSNEDGIMENSLMNFLEVISKAGTVIWNGSMGLVRDNDDYNHASRLVAQEIIKSKAYSVVGGGDTTEFLNKLGILDKFSFASTGGGAMLAFLSGENLPGLVALEKN